MAMPIIMALGLDYTGVQDVQKTGPASVKSVIQRVSPSLAGKVIEENKVILQFESYKDAENTVKAIYKHAEEVNRSVIREKILYFYVVLTLNDQADEFRFATVINLLNGAIEEKQDESQSLAVRVYLTADVYKRLEPKYQDMYHSAVEVAGNALHQRFSQDAQRCFVISPIGAEGSDVRKRADYVFETYVKPACEGTPFRPVRGEMMRGSFVVPELMEALQSDPMVITYLGHRPSEYGWNPNVMMELGSRLGISAPLVVIKDSTSEGKPYDLPFDLKDVRVVEIPEQEEEVLEQGAVKIRTIREAVLAGVKESQWKCVYPIATVDVKVGDSDGISKYTDASRELEALFEMKAIVGREILPILEDLLEKFPECQREPFLAEQERLIGSLVMNSLSNKKVYATVPLVFERHSIFSGKAFLPIIVRHSFNKITSTLRLSIIYMDVTAVTARNSDGYYVCKLVGDATMRLMSGESSSDTIELQ